MSLRKLKYHEAKLLKKVDLINWKQDANLREVKILRRYHIQDREDYHAYNRVCGMVTKLVATLKKIDPRDPVRLELTEVLLDRLHSLVRHHPLSPAPTTAAAATRRCAPTATTAARRA